MSKPEQPASGLLFITGLIYTFNTLLSFLQPGDVIMILANSLHLAGLSNLDPVFLLQLSGSRKRKELSYDEV